MKTDWKTFGVVAAALLIGCGGPQPQPVASGPQVTFQVVKAPFEYKIVKKEETDRAIWGPQIALTLETTNEVAKQATEDDLRQLWDSLQPTVGNRRVFIDLKTPVPGVNPWGVISHLNGIDGKWSFSFSKNEYGVDAEPYNFMDKIDRTKQNQQAMILTLPIVNKIVDRLKRAGWTQKTRSEDLISLDVKMVGHRSCDVTLTPESITLHAWDKDDTEIFDIVNALTQEFGIGSEIKRKMQSVIGSPEYFRGNNNGVGVWNWTIRGYDVDYYHTHPGIDNVSIGYARK